MGCVIFKRVNAFVSLLIVMKLVQPVVAVITVAGEVQVIRDFARAKKAILEQVVNTSSLVVRIIVVIMVFATFYQEPVYVKTALR
jgi:hypothetical protein